jgi:hypothetical protein
MTVSYTAKRRSQVTSSVCALGTLSLSSRYVRSRLDELCASGNILEIYAPAPGCPHDLGWGYFLKLQTSVGGVMDVIQHINKILRPMIWVLAVTYFLIDALFVFLVRPIGGWLDRSPLFLRIVTWIKSLGPYQSLVIFIIPLIVLEPVKPLSLYLISTGRLIGGALFLIVGEAIKILILERIFRTTQPKLMSFRVFAWVYFQVTRLLAHFRSLRVWKSARKWFEEIKAFTRYAALVNR